MQISIASISCTHPCIDPALELFTGLYFQSLPYMKVFKSCYKDWKTAPSTNSIGISTAIYMVVNVCDIALVLFRKV